jgi:predicted deacetylase
MKNKIFNIIFSLVVISILAIPASAFYIKPTTTVPTNLLVKNLVIGNSQPTSAYATITNAPKLVNVTPFVYNSMIHSRPKAIIFRDDDANAFFCETTLKNITNTLINNGISQVISITPKTMSGYTIGNDINFRNYINSIKGNSRVEIAMHGYQHYDNEFGGLSVSQASSKMAAGLSIFKKDLGISPKTFIAPNDVFNNNTVTACKLNGFNVFSSEMGNDDDSFKMKYCGVLHLPSTDEMYDWENNRFRSASDIIDECQNSLDENHVCVIVLHHWQFSDDGCKTINKCNYNKLLDVIKWAKEQQKTGVKLMTMQQYRTVADFCVADP